jgi:Protein of unknown function (DUF1579)
MCILNRSVVLVSIGALALGAGFTLSRGVTAAQPPATQPEKKPVPPVTKPAPKETQPGEKKPATPSMEELMKAGQPGPEHKLLETMLGNWEGDVKFWMGPGTEPSMGHGIAKREMAMDGRFLIEHVDGTMAGMPGPFKGMGITGYNTVEKRYESVWIENSSTWIAFQTGTYDAAKKTMTFEGDMIDPATGKRTKQRSTIDLSNPDRHTMTGFCNGPEGKEFKCFEGTFEKKK